MAVVIDETTGRHALDELGGRLDALNARLGVPLMCRRPWLSAWTTAYPEHEPWAITAWEGDTLVGACLLARRDAGHRIEISALGHGRNDRTRLSAADDDIAQALADRIARRLREIQQPWSMRIEQLPSADRVASALVERIPQASLVLGGSVPGIDFDHERSLDGHLSRNLHRQLQKSRNRIATDGLSSSVAFTRARSELWQHLDEIEEAHRNRDHDVGRTSDIDDPAGRHLWRAIVATHIERGEVEIATLRLDGALAAYVISFVDQSTYRVFDGRFVTGWARYSPGRLLEVATLGHALADRGLQRLDWMNSIAPGKLISANTLEPTVHVVACSALSCGGRPDRDGGGLVAEHPDGPSCTCWEDATVVAPSGPRGHSASNRCDRSRSSVRAVRSERPDRAHGQDGSSLARAVRIP